MPIGPRLLGFTGLASANTGNPTGNPSGLVIDDSAGNPWYVWIDSYGQLRTSRDTTVEAGGFNWNAGGAIGFAEVALTNAEIKALRATPKTLVAAPGTGLMLKFLGCTILMDYGSNALTESTANLAVKYVDGSGIQVSQTIEMTGFIDQTGDMVTNGEPKIDAICTKAQAENKALVLHNLGAGEFGGNAAADTLLRVKVWYRVLATGF